MVVLPPWNRFWLPKTLNIYSSYLVVIVLLCSKTKSVNIQRCISTSVILMLILGLLVHRILFSIWIKKLLQKIWISVFPLSFPTTTTKSPRWQYLWKKSSFNYCQKPTWCRWCYRNLDLEDVDDEMQTPTLKRLQGIPLRKIENWQNFKTQFDGTWNLVFVFASVFREGGSGSYTTPVDTSYTWPFLQSRPSGGDSSRLLFLTHYTIQQY